MGNTILPTGTVTVLVTGSGAEAFDSPASAVAAAVDLRAASTSTRIALHTGVAQMRGSELSGPAVRRCQRLREIANEGQILVSAQTAAVLPDVPLRDLGLHRLRDLASAARVFELDNGGESPPLRSLDAVPNNLPVQLTSFVGRDAETLSVRALLTDAGLVTLTGPGGAGKTRLAAQVAADQATRWPDGVWWVELATVTDSAQVAEAVAAAVGALVEPGIGPVRSVTAELRERRVLICLDNCEHVLDGAADLTDALLRACPEVAVLATSREPLGVPGETVWRIPPLDGDEALALFMERATTVRPWFTLDASSETAVRTMCKRLDGIPLALELAAAWLRTLTPQQIEAGLDNRFALLVRAPRGVPARQQTLAASVDWSHDLLDPVDREVLHRLSVFAGSFTLAAARAVCGDDVLEPLGSLVDKSLVVAEEARFRLLETIRSYAAERLTGTEAARSRHLGYYLALAEAAEPELGRDKDAWRAIVEPERDNLRAALDWGLASDRARGRRLAASLAWLWNLHGRGHEGLAYLRRALELAPDERSLLQVRLLVGIAEVADTTAPFDLDVAGLGVRIATELGDENMRTRCLGLTALDRFYTDFDAAWDLSLEASKSGDAYTRDCAQALRGITLHLRDQHADARSELSAAASGLIARGDRGIATSVLGFLSSTELYTGDLVRARSLALQAVELAEPLGDYHRVGTARGQLALVHCFAGEIDAGMRVMEPFLRLVSDTGAFVPGMARTMGCLHLRRGNVDEAVHWFEREAPATGPAAEAYITTLGLPGLATALRAAGRGAEAVPVLERAVRLARRGGMSRIVADALDQQGCLATDPEQALELHHEALAIRWEHGLRMFYVDSLDALAPLLSRAEDTVRVLAASAQARAELGCPRPMDTEDLRNTLGASRFGMLWDEGAGMPLDDVVAFVRRARGARGRPSTGWASLTPTERDVVRLAVEGLNNPDIGARLFMSRGTVKTHLSHVYAKLGISNRTELATLAAAHPGP
jgi:predicted ATPase/DNA-binding CsgD family transcriptional regulator